jgi:inner membrane protein
MQLLANHPNLMTWPTHVLFGISALWLLVPFPPEFIGYDFGTLAACAALGALLPDLDARESKIKHLKLLGTQFKPFMLAAQIIHQTDQHRELLHSLWGIAFITIITSPLMVWIGWAPVVSLLLGYISHLAADAMTKSGIRLLYPRTRHFHLLPIQWRITTGSYAEEALFLLLTPLVGTLLLHCLLCGHFPPR